MVNAWSKAEVTSAFDHAFKNLGSRFPISTMMSVTSVSSISLVLIRLRFRLETWLYLRNFLKFLT